VVPDTRPTHPIAGAQANLSAGANPYPAPALHSNVTMGMPTPHFVPQQPGPQRALHAQPTLGATPYPYPAGGASTHPSEPVPVIHANTTMGMPLPGYLQLQPTMLQAPMLATNSAMLMPAYANMIDYRQMNTPPRPANKKNSRSEPADDEDEGINVLAVIIFGSLSVTALGGLGMLILLMFTTG
jgi:hypothetical protein